MLTVALSSSTAMVAVAVADGDRVLAERATLTDRRHAEEITPMLVEVLDESGIDIGELRRVVVDIGPGRYTGMRVGIATGTTLAHALRIPVSTVTSLELIARAAAEQGLGGRVIPVIDARRDQVFALLDGVPRILRPEELVDQLPGGATVVGDGADRYRTELGGVARVHTGVVPSISAAATLPAERPAVEVTDVEPMYLREPDAAINIRIRPGGTPR